MSKSLLYVVAVLVLVVWLWHAEYHSFSGPNPAEALGFNLFSVGLPLLLLVSFSRRLHRSLSEREAAAPYKITFAVLAGSLALAFVPDVFNLAASHRLGAGLGLVVFGMAATILLVLAYKAQHRVRPMSSNVSG